MSLGDHIEALFQPFPGGILLRIREQLVRLCPYFPPLIVSELVTHLLNKYQQRLSGAFAMSASFRYTSSPFNNRFGFMTVAQTTENQPLCCKRLSKECVLTTPFQSVHCKFN
jgi:hypothetical protein